jgi:coproporphyrinogen III oxidase-like Fe-S oxidoreductase
MNHYLEGKLNRSVETIDKAGEEFEFLMLNLRLVKGFSLETFKKRFHKDFLMDYRKEIQDVIEYVDYSDGYFRIKKEYIYTMDSILLKILR